MKKVVRVVRSLDDLHLQQGEEVEADVEVRITVGEDEVLALDLTDGNAAKFRHDLLKWIEAARHEAPRRQGHRRKPGEPGIPVCKRPTEGMTLEQGKIWLGELRVWAEAEGRLDEIGGKGDKSYAYGQKLVDDYRAYLVKRADLVGRLS
jgi:hypothetical protein